MIAIRPYRAADRGTCVAIFHRAAHEGAAAFYTEAQRQAWAPRPTPDLSQPDRLLDQWAWVSEEDGRVTGFMSLRPDGYLDMAYVLPEVMGKGHAAALYDRLIAKARQLGLARLTVHANPLSHRFLARRGWRLEEMQPHELRGQMFERSFMSLDLGSPAGVSQPA